MKRLDDLKRLYRILDVLDECFEMAAPRTPLIEFVESEQNVCVTGGTKRVWQL